MICSPLSRRARLVFVCCCLSLAACSGAADDLHSGMATGEARRVADYVAPLEWRAALLAAADTAQPTAAGVSSSMRPPQCVQPAFGGGLSFFVAGGNFGYGAAGLAFGPLAFLTSGGLTAGAASGTSTSYFVGMRLDPRAAWQPLALASPSLQYAAPLDYACGF